MLDKVIIPDFVASFQVIAPWMCGVLILIIAAMLLDRKLDSYLRGDSWLS